MNSSNRISGKKKPIEQYPNKADQTYRHQSQNKCNRNRYKNNIRLAPLNNGIRQKHPAHPIANPNTIQIQETYIETQKNIEPKKNNSNDKKVIRIRAKLPSKTQKNINNKAIALELKIFETTNHDTLNVISESKKNILLEEGIVYLTVSHNKGFQTSIDKIISKLNGYIASTKSADLTSNNLRNLFESEQFSFKSNIATTLATTISNAIKKREIELLEESINRKTSESEELKRQNRANHIELERSVTRLIKWDEEIKKISELNTKIKGYEALSNLSNLSKIMTEQKELYSSFMQNEKQLEPRIKSTSPDNISTELIQISYPLDNSVKSIDKQSKLIEVQRNKLTDLENQKLDLKSEITTLEKEIGNHLKKLESYEIKDNLIDFPKSNNSSSRNKASFVNKLKIAVEDCKEPHNSPQEYIKEINEKIEEFETTTKMLEKESTSISNYPTETTNLNNEKKETVKKIKSISTELKSLESRLTILSKEIEEKTESIKQRIKNYQLYKPHQDTLETCFKSIEKETITTDTIGNIKNDLKLLDEKSPEKNSDIVYDYLSRFQTTALAAINIENQEKEYNENVEKIVKLENEISKLEKEKKQLESPKCNAINTEEKKEKPQKKIKGLEDARLIEVKIKKVYGIGDTASIENIPENSTRADSSDRPITPFSKKSVALQDSQIEKKTAAKKRNEEVQELAEKLEKEWNLETEKLTQFRDEWKKISPEIIKETQNYLDKKSNSHSYTKFEERLENWVNLPKTMYETFQKIQTKLNEYQEILQSTLENLQILQNKTNELIKKEIEKNNDNEMSNEKQEKIEGPKMLARINEIKRNIIVSKKKIQKLNEAREKLKAKMRYRGIAIPSSKKV